MKDHKSNFDRMMYEAKLARGLTHPENAIPDDDDDDDAADIEAKLEAKLREKLGDDVDITFHSFDMTDPEQAAEAMALFQQWQEDDDDDDDAPEGDLMELPKYDGMNDDSYERLMDAILGADWQSMPEPKDDESFEEYLIRSGMLDHSNPIHQVENPSVEEQMKAYTKHYESTPDHHAETRSSILKQANKLVNGERNAQYADPIQDFQRTGDLWEVYLKGVMERTGDLMLEPHDVAVMQILLKVSRLTWSPNKADHWIDIAGYAACGADCAETEFDGLV